MYAETRFSRIACSTIVVLIANHIHIISLDPGYQGYTLDKFVIKANGQWYSQPGGGGGALSTHLCPEYKAYGNVKALIVFCSPCKDIAIIRVQGSTVGGVIRA